ncbi:MAG: SRPBCC family protein [Pseudomonadota bacterium]
MNDREIVTSRLFDAPREQVFRAFSDPAILARWWGPEGFTNTFKVFDFEPKGIWNFVMHGPDGVNYPNEIVFVDVRKPEKVILDHVSGSKFQAEFTLTGLEAKTRLDWTMRFASAAECAKVRHFAVEANEQNLDRLARQLSKLDAAN